jgi:glycosyltransferase involved in cell wall biosynthesis
MYPHAGRLLARAAAVITVSEYSKTSICSAFDVDPQRIHVIPNGVNHDRFTPGSDAVSRLARPYVLYVGGHTPRKNVDRVIAAFARARQEVPEGDLRLVLAGPVGHAQARLRAAAPDDLPADALSFAGHVSDDELVELYRRSLALVSPSLYEGFGMPMLEAMACGTRVIAANRSAQAEVAGDAATLVDPEDVDAVARAMVEVLSETDAQRGEWRERGLARAAHFTWTAAARQTLAIYDDLASQPTRRTAHTLGSSQP